MKTNIKKIAIIAILAFSLSFSPVFAEKTYAWDAIPAAKFKQMLEEISTRIKGIILGALKKQAAQMLIKQTNKAVSGNGKGSNGLIITNWQDYLYKQPQNNTKLYMNDYLSKITSGKGSMTGYKGEGFGGGAGGSGSSGSDKGIGKSGSGNMVSGLLGSGGGGSYASQLVQMAKKTTVDKQQPKMNFEGDPSNILGQGNFKWLDSFLDPTGINNQWAFNDNAKKEYQKKLAEEQKIAQTKAVSYQGFKGVGEGKNGKGTIKTPGSLVKDNTANTQDIGNKIIASATHPEEVISAIVSQMINQVMTQGLGDVSQMMKKQSGANNALNQQKKNNIANQGPGAAFKSLPSGLGF